MKSPCWIKLVVQWLKYSSSFLFTRLNSLSKGYIVLECICAKHGAKCFFLIEYNEMECSSFNVVISWLLRKSRKTAPPYHVILHNDNYNKREYVVQVLMKVIPGMTLDIAVNIMQEAHFNGLAVVIICAQADAEDHCMQLRGNGLLSSIEPASGRCWGQAQWNHMVYWFYCSLVRY